MPATQVNLTIGTAGHIDHGKTSLVKCLTGCDTDRLKEEKERGMSIDLGYAPCTIADMEVGIVDVPGHENFVKTMVAGASGMDAVLLVIASDDGVMPQTREHLDILTLLGVAHGMVVLTKIDRVEADALALARFDVEAHVRGTFLDGAPILPVSCVTGEGFDAFLEALFALTQGIRPKSLDGVFRLPVDRAFSAQGYGAVIAGIPVSGAARLDEDVELLPQGAVSRIRGIEIYGRTSDTVRAGQCAALNVRHVDAHEVRRGDTLATPGYFTAHEWHVCQLRLLNREKVELNNGDNVRFHTGTAEVSAAVYGLKSDTLRSGEEQIVQIHTKTPVVAGPGDRFILRALSPVRTVGGGMIIESVVGKLRRTRPGMMQDLERRAAAIANDRQFVEYCVRTARTSTATEADLARRAKMPLPRIAAIVADLVEQSRLFLMGGKLYMHQETAAELEHQVLAHLRSFHEQSPESPGMTLDQLRETSRLEPEVLDGILKRLQNSGQLVTAHHRFAVAGHRATFRDDEARDVEAVERLFQQRPFQPPGPVEVAEETGIRPEVVGKVLRMLCEHSRLVRVAEDLYFHREAVEQAKNRLREFIAREGRLESVKFKYLLDTTRKYALPLLDYFDKIGVTRRDGNTRFLKS